jgi:predicted kinase
MASIKRKALETQLHRRVRARRDPSEEPEDVLNRRASPTQPHEESRSVHSESDPEDLLENDEGDTSVCLLSF